MPENDIDSHAAPSLDPGEPEHSTVPVVSTDTRTAAPARLAPLVYRARAYVEASSSANTRRAYASDWKHFASWCRRQGLSPLPPEPQTVGLYITALASGSDMAGRKGATVSTIERRLSSLSWNYAQRSLVLDRKDRHIATVLQASATLMQLHLVRRRLFCPRS